MSQASVRATRAVELSVTDLETATRFFTTVWNLGQVESGPGSVHFRGTGKFNHILSLRHGPRSGINRIVLDAVDRTAIDGLHEQIRAAGRPIDGPPRQLPWPGGGYGFGFKDPEGRNFAAVCDVADHAEDADRPDRPRKISHVNLNCAENEATFAFMRDALGFRLSDHANNFHFLRCGTDHHSLVIGFNNDATLNHVAFEMPELDSVMRGIGRMRDHGYPVEWGPGRHGPGDNAFAYFCGPEELPLEYTAEMSQVGEDHIAGSPKDWTWPPGRVDQWGIMAGPTARMKRAQSLFRFSEDGYRLGG
jgi:catechol 2,3-dioxygenase-like lactoylglutathione lyase family enzyme